MVKSSIRVAKEEPCCGSSRRVSLLRVPHGVGQQRCGGSRKQIFGVSTWWTLVVTMTHCQAFLVLLMLFVHVHVAWRSLSLSAQDFWDTSDEAGPKKRPNTDAESMPELGSPLELLALHNGVPKLLDCHHHNCNTHLSISGCVGRSCPSQASGQSPHNTSGCPEAQGVANQSREFHRKSAEHPAVPAERCRPPRDVSSR